MKPIEYDCEHCAFIADADGPMLIVRPVGEERHFYLRLKPAHALLISADSTSYVCKEMQKEQGKSPIE